MTPERLRQCLDIIKRPTPLSQQGLARMLETNPRQVRRWVLGQYPTPPHIETWIEKTTNFYEGIYEGSQFKKLLAQIEEFHANNPPPLVREPKLQTDEPEQAEHADAKSDAHAFDYSTLPDL